MRPGLAHQRIKSPLLHLIIISELLSDNAITCRELPSCPVAGIRDSLRIPDGTGAYRCIRATMEQPSADKGLDHYVDTSRARAKEAAQVVGKGLAARRDVRR